jgi:hypothetical protein
MPAMKTFAARLVANILGRAHILLATVILLGWATPGMAQKYASTEDRTRFQEQPYKQTEPGMLPPSDYVAFAEKAVQKRYPSVHLSKDYEDGVVTHRHYRNAPKADQDIVCVQFVYRKPLGGGGFKQSGYLHMNPDQPVPVVQALIRKDGSKVYVNWVRYKRS